MLLVFIRIVSLSFRMHWLTDIQQYALFIQTSLHFLLTHLLLYVTYLLIFGTPTTYATEWRRSEFGIQSQTVYTTICHTLFPLSFDVVLYINLVNISCSSRYTLCHLGFISNIFSELSLQSLCLLTTSSLPTLFRVFRQGKHENKQCDQIQYENGRYNTC